ncbi:ROK family transcriptional regulator [Streptomyces sp. PSKA54]|uniref:ROK family transcriptional regulator n=1 Tax=Streptomyces himalayensis subsp. aureolus TaxID=2758039 RepID=A0A7W2D4E3_9ACTN|nr:ROK family transcriptional regulator [Streptomyces himalayensis]MBA4864567.1 ROK family transcriptional regulator [Streptomyces himalayensis subsp. aureolus]
MSRKPGGSLRSLRRSNQEQVIALLIAQGPLHRAELARQAGVSRTTVSTIVSELLARGLVTESYEQPDGDLDGRAGNRLLVNPRAAVVAGMNHTFDGVWVHLSDLAAREIASSGTTLDPGTGPAERVEAGASILQRLLDSAGLERQQVIGVGVGVPGPIHRETGVVGVSLPGQPWSHVHAADELQQALGLPVVVENNTRLEGVAEARWGAGRGVANLLYFGLSSGIGSGLILDGRLYRGAVGAAGELGHVSVSVDGAPCPCGNRGCLVLRAGLPAVLAALRPSFGEETELEEMLARTAAGDRAGEKVFTDVGTVVGQVLANLCNLLNPERIVVGGELSRAGEVLLRPMRDAIRRHALSLVRDVDVVPAELGLGARVGALGGAALVLSETPDLAAALNRMSGITA